MLFEKFLKRKKGDIGVTILVIGVFGVCSLALLTFYISDYKISNSFVGLDLMHGLNADIDFYEFCEKEDSCNQGYNRALNLTEDKGYYLFYRELSTSNFNLLSLKSEDVLLFSVSYRVAS